ncbi:MAG: HD-GYP domain-containing protein [Ignavibacteriales bacterium]
MRLVPVVQASPGMRLGRSVFNVDGRLILAAGITLRQRYIDQLLEQGYNAVYIADDVVQVEIPEVVGAETRQQVVKCVVEFAEKAVIGALSRNGNSGQMPRAYHRVGRGERPNLVAKMTRASQMLVEEILSKKEVVIGLLDIKSLNDYTFAHCVQVAVLSIVVARAMRYPRAEIVEMGVGALLHDVGKVEVSEYIWKRKGELSTDEMQIVQLHPERGFDFLRQAKVDLLSAHVALQHHERWDGSGYPRGLKGEQIHKYARLCAVCDVYDAMTSDRPHRNALHPSEALAFLTENAGSLYDPRAVQALTSVVAPYPVASNVLLSTGEIAVVKKLNLGALDRPVVVVTKDPRGRFYDTRLELDLSTTANGVEIVDYALWHGKSGQDASGTDT